MQQRLSFLLERYLNHTATKAELDELFDLISEEKQRDRLEAELHEKWMQQPENEKMKFSLQSEQDVLKTILTRNQSDEVLPETKIHFFQKYWFRIAAAAVIILTAGIYYYSNTPGTDKNMLAVTKDTATKIIKPGGQKAVLTLADGSTIILDDSSNGTLATEGNNHIIKKDGELIYESGSTLSSFGKGTGKGSQNEEPTGGFNTMSTPKGGQYKLRLPDGSKVWLNAESTIKYPVVFNSKERNVSITGEAYFEVATDKNKKFLVNVNGTVTEVLGTNFNVSGYTDEDAIKITLLQGAVKVARPNAKNNGDAKILKPGQQAGWNIKTEKLTVQEADIDAVMAWKNGLFQFNGDDIVSIMKKISKWYDVEIRYAGKIPQGHYNGIVSRSSDLETVLKILEESGLHFNIEGKKLIVL